MSEIWDIHSVYKSGAQRPPFWRFRNLRANLSAYIYETKYDIHKRAKCVANYKGSATYSENDMKFGRQTASNWTVVFTHPS